MTTTSAPHVRPLSRDTRMLMSRHGAIQMLVEPTSRRMVGKWVGFGKDFDVNTGPWELRLMDTSTSKATLERYGVPPE